MSYTFVELLGLRSDQAAQTHQQGQQTQTAFQPLPASISPHAPYSMCRELLDMIYEGQPERVSIHLLESVAERSLFEQQEGAFLAFFKLLQLPEPSFPDMGAAEYVLAHFPSHIPAILVHLTEVRRAELDWINQQVEEAWFCLCPLSNLYINNTFPDINLFLPFSDQVCLGTDSLASNHQLDIWLEMLTIHKRYPQVDWHHLMKWATTNGANALGFGEQIGRFRAGTKPGILRLPITSSQQIITDQPALEVLF